MDTYATSDFWGGFFIAEKKVKNISRKVLQVIKKYYL